MDTALFGFDLVILLGSILKLAQEALTLTPQVTKYLGAAAVVVAVVVVGLQTQGVILGPETEQSVVLALTAISAGLAALGFGPGVVGTTLAVADQVRFKAASQRSQLVVGCASDCKTKLTPQALDDQLQKVYARYNLSL